MGLKKAKSAYVVGDRGRQTLPPNLATQNKKILVFDGWTQGASNIIRLIPALKERGLDISLLHVGSWGHDKNRAEEEQIEGLLVRDISFYRGYSFDSILRQEDPSLVIFLSTQAFIHRAFNRHCAFAGIKTMHLYHGLIGVQQVYSGQMYRVNFMARAKLIFTRMGKNLLRLWPSYCLALWKTKASPQHWAWFAYDIWRTFKGTLHSRVGAPDTKTDACCVYSNGDAEHAITRYRMPTKSVFVVGNPDLAKFQILESDLGIKAFKHQEISNGVMYIDTALNESGVVFSGRTDFVNHLKQTNSSLVEQGFRLIVKLHPGHDVSFFEKALLSYGIQICSDENFISTLKTTVAAIVEPSSAALIPALLGMPVMLACYGKLSNQGYGHVLTDYPRAKMLDSIDLFASALRDMHRPQTFQSDEFSRWVNANLGPMPFEKMPERVAEVCARLALAD